MSSESVHILSIEEVLSALQHAWNLAKPKLTKRSVKDFKLKDFEVLEDDFNHFFRNSENYEIETVSAGALYNLAKNGEGKRNKAIAIVALYILLNENALSEEEKKQYNVKFYGRDIFSKYTNRASIVSKLKEFLSKETPKFINENPARSNKIMSIILGTVVLISLLGAYFLFAAKDGDIDINELWNAEICEDYHFHPCKVKITYDFSNIKFKEAYFDLDKAGILKIEKDKGEFNIDLNFKSTPNITLNIDDKKFLKSLGMSQLLWQGKINDIFVPYSSFTGNGHLHMKDSIIERYVPKSQEFYVTYSKGKNFNVSIDKVIFETRVKNNISGGGVSCFDVSFDISSVKNKTHTPIGFNLLEAGCINWAQIKIGDTFYTRDNYNINPSGIDLSDWRVVKWTLMNKSLVIWIDDEEIYNIPYDEEFGKLAYLQVLFKGNGYLDYYKITSDNGEVLMHNQFD